MTTVAVYSRTTSITYVADNMLRSIKEIVRMSGLDPAKLVDSWDSNLLAMRTWMQSGHLRNVVLEIFDPSTDKLIIRWDIGVSYAWTDDDGSFFADVDQLRYALKKHGVAPASARYGLLMDNAPGRPDVPGWSTGSYRSTDRMVRQSLGATVEHAGLGASTSYWRKS